nr:MAG TPA_asm: hypothetical protein [Caudoviricetes sp.]
MPERGGHIKRELSRKRALVGWRSLPIRPDCAGSLFDCMIITV